MITLSLSDHVSASGSYSEATLNNNYYASTATIDGIGQIGTVTIVTNSNTISGAVIEQCQDKTRWIITEMHNGTRNITMKSGCQYRLTLSTRTADTAKGYISNTIR